MTTKKQSGITPVWCATANIVMERSYEPGGVEKRSGTKHFLAGSKVYILRHFWGMGGEQVTVIGRHRGSHRYVTMTIASKWLTNYRAKLVYSPHIIRLIEDLCEYPKIEPRGEAAKSLAEQISTYRMSLGAKEQPFSTRTSNLGKMPMSSLSSPNGCYEIRIESWEARNSLWVELPEIIDLQSQETILKFRNPYWSLDISEWIDNTDVKIVLRKYPGNHSPSAITITVKCQHRLAILPDGQRVALTGLEEQLNLLL